MSKKNYFVQLRLLLDIILIPIVVILAYSIKFKVGWVFQRIFELPIGTIYEHAQVEPYLKGLFVIELIWIFVFYISGVYQRFSGIMPEVDEITKVVKGISLATLFVMSLTFIYPVIPSSKSVIFYSWLIACILLSSVRLLLHHSEKYMQKKGSYVSPTLIIGANDIGQDLAERFCLNPSFGYKYIGTLDDAYPTEIHYHLKNVYSHLGKPELFRSVIESQNIECVFLTKDYSKAFLKELIEFSHDNQITLRVISEFYKYPAAYNDAINFDGFSFLSHKPISPLKESIVKRLFDICISILAIIILIIPFGLIATWIKIVSPKGAVFYKQERVGKLGKTFNLIKFRTMHADAEKNGPQMVDTNGDSRYIPGGQLLRQYSIDELPQFFNILFGSMSFVGPRPERPFFVEQFRKEIPFYDYRHYCKVGLTGWAQINGRSFLTDKPAHKLRYDLYYIKHRNFIFDLKIILKTFFVVLRGEEAY